MRLPRLFRTNVFRLTLAYMALFALSVGALSAFVYSATLGYLDTQTNVIDVHISRLRSKIDKGFERPLLHTVRGAGYRLDG